MKKNPNIPDRLTFAVTLSLIMFCLLPYSSQLASLPSDYALPASDYALPADFSAGSTSTSSPKASASVFRHFLYMFGHASFLHFIINVWCFLCLSALLTARRFGLAYLSSVAVSFLPLTSAPTLGFSVILFYFYGYIACHLWRRNRFAVVSLLVLMLGSFFLPWIASALHMIMFFIGFAAWHIEGVIVRICKFIS